MNNLRNSLGSLNSPNYPSFSTEQSILNSNQGQTQKNLMHTSIKSSNSSTNNTFMSYQLEEYDTRLLLFSVTLIIFFLIVFFEYKNYFDTDAPSKYYKTLFYVSALGLMVSTFLNKQYWSTLINVFSLIIIYADVL